MKKILFPAIFGLFACTLAANANVIPTLTLTEVSSTQLNWAWDTGQSDSLNSAGDYWDANISIPTLNAIFGNQTYTFTEPFENTHNAITLVWTSTDFRVTVYSDLAGVGQYDDGVSVTAIDNFQTSSFNFLFLDKGDSTGVPDGGNTLLLLLIAGGTLVWMQRRRAGSGV